MSSTIKVDNVVNQSGDNDSGLDLSTNDQIILKTANTTALTVDSSQNVTLAGDLSVTGTASGVGGITHVDQWRLTTTFTGGASPLSSNLERVDAGGQTTIGSAMTFNSGIFSFPVTGKWLVRAFWQHYINGSSRYQSHFLKVTQNNSSYHLLANMSTGITHSESSNTYDMGTQETTVDVTDTSLVKIKFELDVSNSSVSTIGSTDHNATYFTFIRLGDT